MMCASAICLVAVLSGAAMQSPAASEQHRAGAEFLNQARRIESPADGARRDAIAAGIAAEDRALAADPDFLDALVYKYLLLRMQAGDVGNATQRIALLGQADTVEQKARAVRQAHPGLPAVRIDSVDVSARIRPDFTAVLDELHPSRVGGSIPTPTLLRNRLPI